MGIEVGLGRRAGLGVPRAHAQHPFGTRGRHHVAIQLEGRADRGVEELRVEAHFLGLLAGQDGVGRVGEADEGVGVLVLDAAQHGREVFHPAGVALVFHHLDAAALQRHLERGVVFQAEQIVHVDAGQGLAAVGLEHVHQRTGHGRGLLQQQEEVRQLHFRQPFRKRGGRQEGVAKTVGQRCHGEVGVAAPGRQHQVHLVAAHELFVGAHTGFDFAAIVVTDELDRALHPFDAETARGVLLFGPEQVVGLLADLRATGPRAGARHRITDAHGRRLREQLGREGHGAHRGGGALDDQTSSGMMGHGVVSWSCVDRTAIVSRSTPRRYADGALAACRNVHAGSG
ncbi:hypothetical protein D9M68_689730 [compost metagenome]